MELSPILMPDNSQMADYPPRYRLSPAVESVYRSLPEKLLGLLAQCGSDPSQQPPASPVPPTVTVDPKQAQNWAGSSFTNYAAKVTALNNSFTNLIKTTAAVLPLMKQAASISTNGQLAIDQIAREVSVRAGQPPERDDMVEDEWVMDFLTIALNNGEQAIANGRRDASGVADQMQKFTDQIDAKLQANDDALRTAREQLTKTAEVSNLSTGDGTAAQSGAPYLNPYQQDPFGANKLLDGVDGDLKSLIDQNGAQPSTTTPAPGTTQPSPYPSADPAPVAATIPPSSSPSGSGMDMSGLMNSAMLNSLMNGQRGQDDYGNRFDNLDRDRDRYERNQPSLQPIQTTPAQNNLQTPAANPAAPAPAGTPQTTTPASNQLANNAPVQPGARVPDADGAVNYPFPDGVSQKVSVSVAKALDVAFADHGGTDAQKAYAETSAKWRDSKQIGDRVDPNQAMTGDVAVWQNPDSTALVRVTGSGSDASMDVIIAGALMPLHEVIANAATVFQSGGKPAAGAPAVPQVTDGGAVNPAQPTASPDGDGTTEKFTFAGFAHPRGIELSSVTAKNSGDTVVPGAVDAGQGQPVVAMPAS
ncbi:hypothetical protein ACFROC_00470 [Nocardia tengchongensis]|uniref:hypothetical protein n=1 Tax=Nocardia tengchongensis TaxID=2055889 RepID=UPI003688823D